MRKCIRCGEIKELSEYYANPSKKYKGDFYPHCKECHNKGCKKYRDANKEKCAELQKKWRLKNRKRTIASCRSWQKKNPEYVRTQVNLYHERYPEKRIAHYTLTNSLIAGKIKKPDNCSECGQHGKRIESHHEDYSKPLEVIWLCSYCHGKKHRKPE